MLILCMRNNDVSMRGMLHRFGTFGEAAMFVSLMRDQGYFAEVLHDNVAVLWGPLAMGGVAAWVSEEAAESADEVPAANLRVCWLPMEMTMVLGPSVLAVIAITLAKLLVDGLQHAVWYPMEALVSVGSVAVILGICLSLWSCCGWAFSHWIRRVWDDQHAQHRLAMGLHWGVGLVGLLILTPVGVVFTVLVFLLTGGY